MAALSPSASPRLPSPPPIAEDQIGPTSPGLSLSEDTNKFPGAGNVDTGASRRIRPGTRAEDMAEGPPLVELQDIDSAFPLTEHLKALHHSHTHPSHTLSTTPMTSDLARQLAQPPPNTSKEIWLYELGRFLIQKTNAIIIALFADSPSCSAQTCPEMRASEWQYLCAVHDPPKSCSAIDYCCHTLDWAASTLTASKMFPSRLGLGSGSGVGAASDKMLQQQMKEITNIFRRVYRIYAHAWFQHREMFWRVEGNTGLYVFFKTVCDEYGMIQPENYTIPPEAEGLETSRDEQSAQPTLLRRDELPIHGPPDQNHPLEPIGNHTVAAGDTTKRHRHTLSDRASSVSTVIHEEAEEDEENQGRGRDIDDDDDKPSLERQATSLRDFAQSLSDRQQQQQADNNNNNINIKQEGEKEGDGDEETTPVDPKPSVITRSETITPEKAAANGDTDDATPASATDDVADAAESADVTVVELEVKPEEEGETEGDAGKEEVEADAEILKPVETASASPVANVVKTEEAEAKAEQADGKSVGD
ncbi:hypothetical protein MBLNU230_g3252t1 [Neophaeotheca triangularis]